MLNHILAGAGISIVTFGIHALVTGLIVVVTRHIAGRTDDLHVFMRVTALMLVTVLVLTAAHLAEVVVWAIYYASAGIETPKADPFEFAFKNYTALGYGDVVQATASA